MSLDLIFNTITKMEPPHESLGVESKNVFIEYGVRKKRNKAKRR